MFLWSLNVFFCVACMFMFYINIARAEHLMKERYPELHFREASSLTIISTAIKIFLVSICPIFNIALLCTLIFRDNEMIESAVQQSYESYHKNKLKEGKDEVA